MYSREVWATTTRAPYVDRPCREVGATRLTPLRLVRAPPSTPSRVPGVVPVDERAGDEASSVVGVSSAVATVAEPTDDEPASVDFDGDPPPAAAIVASVEVAADAVAEIAGDDAESKPGEVGTVIPAVGASTGVLAVGTCPATTKDAATGSIAEGLAAIAAGNFDADTQSDIAPERVDENSTLAPCTPDATVDSFEAGEHGDDISPELAEADGELGRV